MLNWLKASVVIRTTLVVLGVTLVMGLLANYFALHIAQRRAVQAQKEVMEILVDVVDASAVAACFVGDKGLADQIVKGLIKTDGISKAFIKNEKEILASANHDKPGLLTKELGVLEHPLFSPFVPGQRIGALVLEPDMKGIQPQVERTVALMRVVVFTLTLVLGIALAFTVHHSVTRPIRNLSGKLHTLEAATGARLTLPYGHEEDEIGQLVKDVNALVERLMDALWAEHELREQLELDRRKVQSILEHAGTGIFVVRRDGAMDAWTPAFLRLLDLETAPPPKGTNFPVLFGLNAGLAEGWLNKCLDENVRVMETFEMQDLTGDKSRWLQITLDPLASNWIQGLLDDVTIHKQATQAAEELAVRDALTGVLNRLGAEKMLAERLPSAFKGVGVMLLDLDKFKEVNDTHGHDAGDVVLREVASRMRQTLRSSDEVARLGGDEFVLAVNYLSDEAIAMNIAQKIIHALGAPITIKEGVQVQIGVSIGITLYHAHEHLPWEAVLKRADRAMYLAKQEGRNCARLAKA